MWHHPLCCQSLQPARTIVIHEFQSNACQIHSPDFPLKTLYTILSVSYTFPIMLRVLKKSELLGKTMKDTEKVLADLHDCRNFNEEAVETGLLP